MLFFFQLEDKQVGQMGRNEKMGNRDGRKYHVNYDISGGASAFQHFFTAQQLPIPLFSILNMLVMYLRSTF